MRATAIYPERVLRAHFVPRRRAAGSALTLVALFAICGATTRAYAHPLVDEGYRRYSQADFSGALDTFGRAWSGSGLERRDVVRILAGRAMVFYATNDTQGMRAALASLAALEPSYAFPREAPPELAQGLAAEVARLGGALAIEVTVEWRGEDAQLSARVGHDPGRMVGTVELHARTQGAHPLEGEGTLLVAGAGQAVVYWAEAIGPGGAVLATEGSQAAPHRAPRNAVALGVPEDSSAPGGTTDSGGGISPWIWVGIGAVVVIAVVGALLLVCSGGTTDSTQPGAPFVL